MKRKLESDPWAVGWTIRVLVLIAFLAALGVPTGLIPIVAVATDESGELTQVQGPITISLGTPTPTGTLQPLATPTPRIPKIGIIAGHAGSDSGAICDDGLQEVDINRDVANRVVASLQAR